MRLPHVAFGAASLACICLIGYADPRMGGVVAFFFVYGLATASVAKTYRSLRREGARVPIWLAVMERYRRYIANEDTTDLNHAAP